MDNLIKNSFPEIEKLFSKKALFEFIDTPEKDLYLYHFGLGTYIRNHLLSCHSPLYQAFTTKGILEPDDMSEIIIKSFYKKIKG